MISLDPLRRDLERASEIMRELSTENDNLYRLEKMLEAN